VERVPSLTFLVVADHYRYVRELVEALRVDDERDRIEVVVGAPSEAEFGLDETSADGLELRVVETGRVPLQEARGIAARTARAPHVFVGETHCFPEPGWGRAILAAHEEGWDVVVPAMTNANPGSTLSCAAFLLSYGRFAAPASQHELDAVPTHNASIPRDSVAAHFDSRWGFADVAHDEGERIVLAPAARMAHLNVTGRRDWLRELYGAGRLYGADRSRGWPPARRFAYAAAAPLLPFVQVAHALRRTGIGRFRSLPPLTLPAMLLGSAASIAGEVAAYAVGQPSPATHRQVDEFEVHRLDYAARG
jgi:hypothetical protein